MAKPCNDCGNSSSDLAATIVKACGYCGNAHAGIAALYDQAARISTTEEDRIQFKEAAEKHRRMARDCAEVVVPEEMKNEVHTPVGS